MICDYMSAAKTVGNQVIKCEKGGCPHYGRCLPVVGIRETPEHAIGEHTKEKGEYYHNIFVAKSEKKGWWARNR